MSTETRVPLESISQSSSLAGYGYDAERLLLAVQFNGRGAIWQYANVPLEVALAFGAAQSKGTFYAKEIRSKYSGARMTGPCPQCGDEGYLGDACADCGTATYAPKEKKGEDHGHSDGESES